MPANRQDSPWHPVADFQSPWQLEAPVDERVVDFWDERQVADCLREGELSVYEWCELDVDALALESAQKLIEQRKRLLNDRLVVSRARQNPASEMQTFYLASITRDGKHLRHFPRPVAASRNVG